MIGLWTESRAHQVDFAARARIQLLLIMQAVWRMSELQSIHALLLTNITFNSSNKEAERLIAAKKQQQRTPLVPPEWISLAAAFYGVNNLHAAPPAHLARPTASNKVNHFIILAGKWFGNYCRSEFCPQWINSGRGDKFLRELRIMNRTCNAFFPCARDAKLANGEKRIASPPPPRCCCAIFLIAGLLPLVARTNNCLN
jgi:hypothetical protein